MTELERKALLGDPEAQRECTEKGIALPCPCCGKPVQWDFETKLVLHDYGDCILGRNLSPLSYWNSRPTPPIGRCRECKHGSYDAEYGNRWCNLNLGSRIVRENDYCNNFNPKEREENEKSVD